MDDAGRIVTSLRARVSIGVQEERTPVVDMRWYASVGHHGGILDVRSWCYGFYILEKESK